MRSQTKAALLLLCWPTAADAQSIRDFWKQRQPIKVLTTTKSSAALEMCLGLEAGETGVPAVFRGEGETRLSVVLIATSFATVFGFRILDDGATRRVELWARGFATGLWERRALAAADACALNQALQ